MREYLAALSSASFEQREVDEPQAKFRSASQRDRDRILYSSAFQRLGGITQVASPESGHHFHSRLTHSLKVGQVARRLCERLLDVANTDGASVILDPDAVEAAALAHDFGHPPFGHLAEEVLCEKAAPVGGFEGNAQTFRILTRLSSRSVDAPGLNLSRRVVGGTIKYPDLLDKPTKVQALLGRVPTKVRKGGAYEADAAAFAWARRGSGDRRTFEAVAMDWADDVTYAVHDMDDFFRAGLIPLDRLCSKGHQQREFARYVSERHPERNGLGEAALRLFSNLLPMSDPYRGVLEDRISLRALGSLLITRYINAVELGREGESWFVEIPEALRNEVTVLKDLTWRYVIERPSLTIIQRGQRRVISELFDAYAEDAESGSPRLFPPAYAERLEDSDAESRLRTVADLVASLTEAGAWEIHRRMGGFRGASIVDATGEHA